MKLNTKLISSYLGVGIIPLVIATVILFLIANGAFQEMGHLGGDALEKSAFNKLVAVREIKKKQIENYFKNTFQNMKILARSKDFAVLYSRLLEYHEKMHTKPDGSYDVSTDEYKKIWSELGVNIEKFQKESGVYDVFLICAAHGHVMYSACKESDLGANLKHGKLKNSGLHKLIEKVIQKEGIAVVDFSPYAPSNNDPSFFIGSPIFDNNHKMIGVMAFQMSSNQLNDILQQRNGLGETEEIYLVGQDKLMRTDSHLDKSGTHSVKNSFKNPSSGSVDTEAVKEVFAGKTDHKIITDYNGSSVLSAYAPIKIEDITWGIIAEIDESEAFAAVKAMENKEADSISNMILFCSIIVISAIVLIGLIGWSIAKSISTPINVAVDNMGQGADQVKSASSEVSSSGQSLASGASEQAASLEEISASLEEMTAITQQNTANASQANTMSDDAAKAANSGITAMETMTSTINEIKISSNQTAKIIKTIDEIAFQTNLLALNAAVEAARAGEAGKGFAVVAEEVRNLAQRSAQAAKDTSALIEESQKNADNGVNAADEVNKIISNIADSVTKVSQLIGEVSVASNEQSQGINQVNEAVAQLDQLTQSNAANAEEAAASGEELDAQANELQSVVASLTAIVEGVATSANSSSQMVYAGNNFDSSPKRPKAKAKPKTATIANNRSKQLAHSGQTPDEVIPMNDSDFENF